MHLNNGYASYFNSVQQSVVWQVHMHMFILAFFFHDLFNCVYKFPRLLKPSCIIYYIVWFGDSGMGFQGSSSEHTWLPNIQRA